MYPDVISPPRHDGWRPHRVLLERLGDARQQRYTAISRAWQDADGDPGPPRKLDLIVKLARRFLGEAWVVLVRFVEKSLRVHAGTSGEAGQYNRGVSWHW